MLDLPFDKFLDFYCDGSLRALLKPSHPKKLDWVSLCKAGEFITDQYYDAVGGKEGLRHIMSMYKIQQLESKADRIQAIIDVLQVRYNEDLVKALRNLGVRTPISEATLKNDLIKAVNVGKKYLMDAEQVKASLPDKKDGEKPKREAFEEVLATIDPKLQASDITLHRYTVLYNQIVRKHEQNTNKNGKRKNK